MSERTAGTITKITPNGTKTLYASGLTSPTWLALDASGNLFVSERFFSDTRNKDVVKITPSGTKTPFATQLSGPDGLAFDKSGILFVADSDVNYPPGIFKYTVTGSKSTFATSGLSFMGALAFDVQGNLFVIQPAGLAFDAAGNLFVSVPKNQRSLSTRPREPKVPSLPV